MAKKNQSILLLLFLSTFWSASLFSAEESRWNFDKGEVGRAASGLVTNTGSWEIRRDPTAPSRPNVYAQTSTKDIEDYFPLAVIPTAVYKDFVATVKIKPISGEMDRSGGVVFRAKGADNYYVVRIEAIRGSIAVYKMVRGTRSMIVWAKANIKTNEWQTLGVEVKGNRIDGSVNGQRLLTLYDDTFLDAGTIGIWTKSDAVTYFDDLTISKMD